MRVLDTHRLSLGATELRAYATEQMSDLILADRTIPYKKEEQEREAA